MEFENNLKTLTDEQLIQINGGDDDTNAFYQTFRVIFKFGTRVVETIAHHPDRTEI